MLGSAHFAEVAVLLWTSEIGPTQKARIRIVTAYTPSGTLEVHMALFVRRPEGHRTADTRSVAVKRITVESCKEIGLSCCRLFGVTRKPSVLQDSGK